MGTSGIGSPPSGPSWTPTPMPTPTPTASLTPAARSSISQALGHAQSSRSAAAAGAAATAAYAAITQAPNASVERAAAALGGLSVADQATAKNLLYDAFKRADSEADSERPGDIDGQRPDREVGAEPGERPLADQEPRHRPQPAAGEDQQRVQTISRDSASRWRHGRKCQIATTAPPTSAPNAEASKA